MTIFNGIIVQSKRKLKTTGKKNVVLDFQRVNNIVRENSH